MIAIRKIKGLIIDMNLYSGKEETERVQRTNNGVSNKYVYCIVDIGNKVRKVGKGNIMKTFL
jgi:hypothetical protein